MAFDHIVTKFIQTPEGTTSQPVTLTGSGVGAVNDTIATGQTDKLVNVAFDKDDLKSVYILSDQNVTLETNATDHSGGDSISLLAGIPLEWQAGGYYACPFTADVTKFYITNASGSTATMTIRYLVDATPG